MELTKLKIELYDIAAIVIPGIFCMAEVWVALFGALSLLHFLHDLKGTELTLLVLCSFALGNLVQEAGNRLLTAWKGTRFFKQARDEFWKTHDGELVRAKVKADSACELSSVDSAFEYCLTRITGKFLKRDVFLAISDFCRSLWLLSLCAVLPLARISLAQSSTTQKTIAAAGGMALIALIAWLSWLRMVRFRALSETPVFTTFIACGTVSDSTIENAGKKKDED